MAAQNCISTFLHTLRMAFLTLPLLIVHTQARIVEWKDLGSNYSPSRYASFPFLAEIHAGQVDTLAKTRRRREGIFDECCRKPCTFNELYSYCK